MLCVEMVALTAVRAGEALGARWDEIDVEAARWTIPGSRMKAGREFCVPLSTGALDVLERARALSPELSLVFPSKTGGLLVRNAPGRVLRRAGVASTPHGLRSNARRPPSIEGAKRRASRSGRPRFLTVTRVLGAPSGSSVSCRNRLGSRCRVVAYARRMPAIQCHFPTFSVRHNRTSPNGKNGRSCSPR